MRKRMIERIQAGLHKCVEEPHRFHRLGHIKSHAHGELIGLKASKVLDLAHQIKPFPAEEAKPNEGWWIHASGDNGKIIRIYGCLGAPPEWYAKGANAPETGGNE